MMDDEGQKRGANPSCRTRTAPAHWTGVFESLPKLLQDAPIWYRSSAILLAIVFGLAVAFAIVADTANILNRDTAAFWAALLTGMIALTTFALGRLAEVMTKRDNRERTQADIMITLRAEIYCNIDQQRRVYG